MPGTWHAMGCGLEQRPLIRAQAAPVVFLHNSPSVGEHCRVPCHQQVKWTTPPLLLPTGHAGGWLAGWLAA
jgi:hypothetical protein